MKLRSRLIRVAYANPSLRKDILPLLKVGGAEDAPIKNKGVRFDFSNATLDLDTSDVVVGRDGNVSKRLNLHDLPLESQLDMDVVSNAGYLENFQILSFPEHLDQLEEEFYAEVKYLYLEYTSLKDVIYGSLYRPPAPQKLNISGTCSVSLEDKDHDSLLEMENLPFTAQFIPNRFCCNSYNSLG